MQINCERAAFKRLGGLVTETFNLAWNEKVAHKRKDDLDNLFQCIPRRKALATISQTFEPINGSWTAEDVEKLYVSINYT